MRTSLLLPLLLIPVLALAMVGTVLPARAQQIPPQPPVGADPMGAPADTNVELVDETIAIEIRTVDQQKNGLARVSANYRFFNRSSQDEKIKVRFPVGPVVYDGSACFYSSYPPIRDLAVTVGSIPVQGTVVNATVDTGQTSGSAQSQIPCWKEFSVTFPRGQSQWITANYSLQGYSPDGSPGTIEYNYILSSAAGWFNPVGGAKLTFHLPYDLNERNFLSCQVGGTTCQQTSDELSWSQEKFEPDANFRVDLTSPSIWMSILAGEKKTGVNPKDVYAWTGLAKAYQQAAQNARGFRQDKGGQDLFDLALQAYQQAILLQPNDPELHASLAGMLCWKTETNPASNTPYSDWNACLREIKAALDLRPTHAGALALLKHVNGIFPGLVDLTPTQPVFLALTGTPTQAATEPPALPSATATTGPAATSTVVPTLTPTTAATATSAPTATNAPTDTPVVASTPAVSAPPPLGASFPPGLFAVLGLLLVLGAYGVSRMRVRKP